MSAPAKADAQSLHSSFGNNLAALRHYSELKLDLAAIIRSLRQWLRAKNDGAGEAKCQTLMARVAEDRFNLAVVGQFNRGNGRHTSTRLLGSLEAEIYPSRGGRTRLETVRTVGEHLSRRSSQMFVEYSLIQVLSVTRLQRFSFDQFISSCSIALPFRA